MTGEQHLRHDVISLEESLPDDALALEKSTDVGDSEEVGVSKFCNCFLVKCSPDVMFIFPSKFVFQWCSLFFYQFSLSNHPLSFIIS